MAKKSPPRGKLLKLKPKAKAKPAVKAKPAAKAKPGVNAKPAPRPRVPLQRMPPKIEADENEERLREAMEELTEARTELSRLGHEMTAAHRQIEDNRLSSASARENLRAELNAVRTDLKTALAEAEIARIDRERTVAQSQRRIHELEDALARLRSEVSELRAAPLGPPPTTGGGGHKDEPTS
jgi:predicted RNase H-like nuclease (RuvC/YqgF family)